MNGIDTDTVDQIRKILMLSRSRGQDPVAVLERAGLLRHRQSRTRDSVQVIDLVIEIIENAQIPPGIRTPLDLKQAIIKGLKEGRDDIAAQQ